MRHSLHSCLHKPLFTPARKEDNKNSKDNGGGVTQFVMQPKRKLIELEKHFILF